MLAFAAVVGHVGPQEARRAVLLELEDHGAHGARMAGMKYHFGIAVVVDAPRRAQEGHQGDRGAEIRVSIFRWRSKRSMARIGSGVGAGVGPVAVGVDDERVHAPEALAISVGRDVPLVVGPQQRRAGRRLPIFEWKRAM